MENTEEFSGKKVGRMSQQAEKKKQRRKKDQKKTPKKRQKRQTHRAIGIATRTREETEQSAIKRQLCDSRQGETSDTSSLPTQSVAYDKQALCQAP